jgi:hypothetical protein
LNIAGVSKTLIQLLERGYRVLHPPTGSGDIVFKLFSTANFKDTTTNTVSLFLYRVEVEPTRRHRTVAPTSFGDPEKVMLLLDLHYLLTVWVTNAESEQQILQECIEILERNPIVSDAQLATGYDWDPGDSLKVTLGALSHEDMMRLWDSVDPAYRLSVPYLVRGVRLTPQERPSAPPVTSRVHVYTQEVP